jgi:hypothetical protein
MLSSSMMGFDVKGGHTATFLGFMKNCSDMANSLGHVILGTCGCGRPKWQ